MEVKEIFEMLNKYAENRVNIYKRKPGDKYDFSEDLIGFNMEHGLTDEVTFLIQGSHYEDWQIREEAASIKDIEEWYESYKLAKFCFGDEDE